MLCPKSPVFSPMFSTRSVIKCQFSVPNAQWGQTILKCWSLEQGKFYWKAIQGEAWLIPDTPGPPPQSAPDPGKVPNSWKGFSKALLKVRWQRGMVSFSWLPGVGFLCFFICPCRSGHDIPINLQQDKCCSMFCKFLSLYEWTLGGQTPEIRLPVYFML